MGTVGEKTLYYTLMLSVFQEQGIPVIRLPRGMEATSRAGGDGVYRFFFNNTGHGQSLRLEGQKRHLQPFEMKILTPGGRGHNPFIKPAHHAEKKNAQGVRQDVLCVFWLRQGRKSLPSKGGR